MTLLSKPDPEITSSLPAAGSEDALSSGSSSKVSHMLMLLGFVCS